MVTVFTTLARLAAPGSHGLGWEDGAHESVHDRLPFCESTQTHRPMEAGWAGHPQELQMTDRGPEMSSDLPKVTQLGNARAGIQTPISCTHVPAPHRPAEGRGQFLRLLKYAAVPGRDTHDTPDEPCFRAILGRQNFQVGSHVGLLCTVVQINAPCHISLGGGEMVGTKLETKMGQKKKNPTPKPQTKKAV